MIVRLVSSFKYRVWNKLVQNYILKSICEHGSEITLGEGIFIAGYNHVYLGSHIYIGAGARFLCTEADIKIGNYVMFGPEVMIITGNHRTNVIGSYMYNVTEKLPENDQPVIIEDDVWIGARVIILKGCTIGTGSVIAAGVVVTENVPPYSIYFGRGKIKRRFDDETSERHMEMIRNEKEFYSKM